MSSSLKLKKESIVKRPNCILWCIWLEIPNAKHCLLGYSQWNSLERAHSSTCWISLLGRPGSRISLTWEKLCWQYTLGRRELGPEWQQLDAGCVPGSVSQPAVLPAVPAVLQVASSAWSAIIHTPSLSNKLFFRKQFHGHPLCICPDLPRQNKPLPSLCFPYSTYNSTIQFLELLASSPPLQVPWG